MPYTPPAQQSPVASKPSSPVLSRSHSYSKSQPINSHGPTCSPASPRPGLPRSASSTSYLTKHRRSPSSPMISSAMFKGSSRIVESPESTPVPKHFKDQRSNGLGGNSVRQSPPPVNDLSMPTGAVISPPDSAQNSSDDEVAEKRGRSRKLDNLAELQAAISVIEQHREGSPNSLKREADKARVAVGLLNLNGQETPSAEESVSSTPELLREGRKISHGRSATESAVIEINRPKVETPDRSSDSDIEDDERIKKPPMLRKKSGELVRPALRPASAKRRPSSMPGTPTYSKAVHFDSHLEHVRHFLQVDKPLAVSANSSPVDNYEGELEFPFGTAGKVRDPPWQWEIKLPNFPHPSINRKQHPVHVERVFLTSDGRTLVGVVAVQNLCFHKTVVARFTLDHWKTTSEVTAEYNNDTKRVPDGFDRFNFNIKIEDLANNIENRTLFFCVRYVANGQEYWDSNGHVNFQVNFVKKAIPQMGKQGIKNSTSRPLSSLPRSRPSPPTSAGKPRPKSASSFDDFAHGLESFPPPSAILNETPIRFRNPTTAPATSNDELPVSPTLRKKAPAQAFGNRYDFGASLSAAIQAAATTLGDRSGLLQQDEAEKKATLEKPPSTSDKSRVSGVTPQAISTEIAKPAALTSDKPDVKSPSYSELLDKYCFYGSGKSTPQGKPGNGSLDGSDDSPHSSYNSSRASSSNNSPAGSPPMEQVAKPSLISSTSSQLSRSSSPAVNLGSRTESPVQFGYPYHQTAMHHSIFPESHTPTAILG